MHIGVLAIQGSVIEHMQALQNCGVTPLEVRSLTDLEKVNGLILPGGESTTIGKLLERYGLDKVIIQRVQQGFPVYGTCAGAILMSKKAHPHEPQLLKIMDIEIQRNAYGSQLDSFSTPIELLDTFWHACDIPKHSIPAVFIRAPRITKLGESVTILADYQFPVLVRENNLLASTFHPELTHDLTVHQYFVDMVKKT